MRCFHLLDTDGFAGTERHVLSLCRQLRRRGVEAEIGCRSGSAVERVAAQQNIPVHSLGGRPGPIMLKTLLQSVRRLRPELVHAHNGRTQLMGAVVHQLTGVPLFATQHFLDPQFTTYRGAKRAAANAAHRWVNRRVTKFVAVSEAARIAMLAREHLSADHVVTIPNGIEPLGRPSTAQVFRVRTELKVQADAPLVVTVARLVAEKGITDLIDALPLVSTAIEQARFVIVGEGGLLVSLREQVERLGVKRFIQFAGFRADATDLIAAADLFVLPSPAEPFGLVLLEAMALERPVVATAAGGPLEIVEDGLTGRLVPPNNPAALGTTIVAMLSDRNALDRMGTAGLQRFEQYFTADRMTAATLNLYSAGYATNRLGGATAIV